MKFKDWCKVIFGSAVMFAFMMLVYYGAWCLFVDTGRAILH